jgi:L-alanine-DL-glutamate epimerase-like enolase superfamily enzyme
MTIESIDIYRYSIPMVPFTIATGTMHYAQNMLVYVHTSQGITGIGECSAFPMIVGETQDTCLAVARDFARIWKGKDATEKSMRMQELDACIAGNHTAKSAFDMALYDLASKAVSKPLYAYLGGEYAEPESDLTIGIGTPEAMAAHAVEFTEKRKANILKVKLGKQPEEDIERIKAIRGKIPHRIQIRIDANQGWDYEGAVLALTGMESYNIEFCEQPMARFLDDKMPSLKRISRIPIMADESVFDHRDAQRLLHAHACDAINIKLCKAGGIAGALRIHEVCRQAGIPNMLGGMLESRLALSAMVHVALACPNILYYDLDTCLLGHLEDKVVNGVVFDGLRLKIPNLPGIGADIDPAYLAQCEKFSI